MTFRVIAPLVIVADRDDVLHHRYFGDVIVWLDDKTADRLVLDGMIVEEGGVEMVADPAIVGKPKRAALKDAWVDYAVSQNYSRAEAEGMSRQDLIELFA